MDAQRIAAVKPEHLTLMGVRPERVEAAELYETWVHRVRGYVGFRVREPSDVEDLVGEVFRRVVSGPAPADPAARPAWIFRVAHNVVIDHYRHRRFSLVPAAFLDRADDAPSLPDQVIHDDRTPGGSTATGHCTLIWRPELTGADGFGTCVFVSGTGALAGFHANLKITDHPDTLVTNWDGTYWFAN